MPKAEAHFDAAGILQAVYEQEVGLRVTTNNPSRFRQIMYKAARDAGKRLHLYTYPKRPNSFALMREARPSLKEETSDAG